MFQWDKTVKTLDVPVGKVLHLFRSMRDVQLALPGLPAQEARAYLCQYRTEHGVGTTTVFHLHKSGQLAFYVNTPREVPAEKADSMLDQALVFVESMGFLMTDLDLHLLGESDREMLWSSLPLQQGLRMAEKDSSSQPTTAQQVPPQSKSVEAQSAQEPSAPPALPPVPITVPTNVKSVAGRATEQPSLEKPTGEENINEQTNVDDLLAAVEELRTRRPGVRARKKPPSPEELKRRRQELRENLGHILASL
jgi:hypothetical protein